MKAAVLQGFGQPLSLADVPTPQPEADEVLLRVEACSVCHSDLHIVDGDTPGLRAATKSALIPGHEVVGIVVARGAGVAHLSAGQRVGVAWLHWACGTCEACREGRENLCRKGTVTGMTVGGGYAEFVRAKASHALPVPEALGPVEAAPLFYAGVTSYRALRNAGVGAGQRVAVVGIGGLGHLAVQLAHALGAEVIALDIAEDRLAEARELGAAHTFDAAAADTPKAVRALGGVHVAVVTSAGHAAYALALKLLRPGGTLSVVGLPPQPLAIPALAVVSGEFRIVGSAGRHARRPARHARSRGRGPAALQRETRPLAAFNEVLDAMRAGKVHGRTVLLPDSA